LGNRSQAEPAWQAGFTGAGSLLDADLQGERHSEHLHFDRRERVWRSHAELRGNRADAAGRAGGPGAGAGTVEVD
jgi:hypothetical protein